VLVGTLDALECFRLLLYNYYNASREGVDVEQ